MIDKNIEPIERLINDDRCVKIDIAYELKIRYVRHLHLVIHRSLDYCKVCVRWVRWITDLPTQTEEFGNSNSHWRRFEAEGEESLSRTVTVDETRVSHCEPQSKRQSMVSKYIQHTCLQQKVQKPSFCRKVEGDTVLGYETSTSDSLHCKRSNTGVWRWELS